MTASCPNCDDGRNEFGDNVGCPLCFPRADAETILTDENGRPFNRPAREDYSNYIEWLHAMHTWRDAITIAANEGFDAAISEQRKKSKFRAMKGKR